MPRTDRLVPFLAGIGVTALLVGGVALALPDPQEGDPAEVLVEQAASVEKEPVSEPTLEPVDEPAVVEEAATTVLAIGPLSAVEAGQKPPKPRLKVEAQEVDEEEVEEVPVEKPKVEVLPAAEKPKVDADRSEAKKKHSHKKHSHKKHGDRHRGVHAHGEVTACEPDGDGGATLDWTARVKGDWTIIDADGGEVDGSTVSFSGVEGRPFPDHPKVKVAATIIVERADGSGKQKEVRAGAWAHLDHEPCT